MPGTVTPVLSHSAPIRRLTGIDVAQLLRDIGEASANTSPLELFRLCLDAQHILSQLDTGAAETPTQDEAKLLADFRATDTWGRAFMRRLARQQATRDTQQRPTLTLVQRVQHEVAV
jgi:hypothetical protein